MVNHSMEKADVSAYISESLLYDHRVVGQRYPLPGDPGASDPGPDHPAF